MVEKLKINHVGFLRKKYKRIWKKIDEKTAFLTNAVPSQRLFHIVNNMDGPASCLMCKRASSSLKWHPKYGYTKYCCIECKRKGTVSTNLQIYGHRSPSGSSTVKQSVVKTNQLRYGKNFAEERLERSRKTCLSKYGSENPWGNKQIREKISYTMMERYGVENISSLESTSTKREQTWKEKYGKSHPNQRHLADETLVVINDIEWIREQLKTRSVNEISKSLGVATTTLYKKIIEFNIELPKTFSSEGERELSTWITTLTDDVVLTRNKTIFGTEIDIVIPNHQVAIEFNGNYWHSEINGKTKTYHIQKTQKCTQKNVSLLHIFEHEWTFKRPIIQSIIKQRIGCIDKKIYARQCKVITVTKDRQKTFLDENHLQGYVPCEIAYGLEFDSSLVMIMTFGLPRYNKKYDWELLRMCSLCDVLVIGGASKLFNYFTRIHEARSVVSYSDQRLFYRCAAPSSYERMGFVWSHNSAPNYFYFKRGNPLRLLSRVKFQKHKLKKVLATFDSKLTEWENMKNNGYDRIWDCGNAVYFWNRRVI